MKNVATGVEAAAYERLAWIVQARDHVFCNVDYDAMQVNLEGLTWVVQASDRRVEEQHVGRTLLLLRICPKCFAAETSAPSSGDVAE